MQMRSNYIVSLDVHIHYVCIGQKCSLSKMKKNNVGLMVDEKSINSRDGLSSYKNNTRHSVEHCSPHPMPPPLPPGYVLLAYLIDFRMIKLYLLPVCWQSMEEVLQ